MNVGVCKLCLQTKELCTESHIIPKFLYKLISGENNALVYVTSKNAKTRHNSEYESDILCVNCENNVLGKLDDYAAKFLHTKSPVPNPPRLEEIGGILYAIKDEDPNYNYATYKLFLLSLLWRSSISSRAFFGKVKLPPENEEELRSMVLKGYPGTPDKYPIWIFLPPLFPAPGGGLGFNLLYMPTMSPESIKNEHWNIVQFVILGMRIFFLISGPPETKVEPSVDLHRILFRISTVQEQSELHRSLFEMMKGHSPKKN